MNAIEFTTELNNLIGRALKEGVDKREMDPSQIIGAMQMQEVQLIIIFAQQFAAMSASRIVRPG